MYIMHVVFVLNMFFIFASALISALTPINFPVSIFRYSLLVLHESYFCFVLSNFNYLDGRADAKHGKEK